MIQIYKSISETNSSLKVLDSIENGCWINVVAPSEEELILISKKTGVPLTFLRAPLDDEETSRIDFEDGFTLVVVDIPFTEMEDNSLTYDTYPLAIIHSEKEIITICLKNSRIITDFINGRVKSFFSFKKSRPPQTLVLGPLPVLTHRGPTAVTQPAVLPEPLPERFSTPYHLLSPGGVALGTQM